MRHESWNANDVVERRISLQESLGYGNSNELGFNLRRDGIPVSFRPAEQTWCSYNHCSITVQFCWV